MLKTYTNQPAQSEDPPSCFGKYYDYREPKCMGGRDATYTNESGEHYRSPCVFRTSCSAKTNSTTNFVPVSTLTRDHSTPTTKPWQSTSWGTQSQTPWRTPATGSWQQPPQHQQAQYWQHPPAPYGMPPYLSVREPIETPRGKRLMVEALRSVFKSLGHTIANFFDSESFSKR